MSAQNSNARGKKGINAAYPIAATLALVDVRAAVKKLTDPALLAMIALEDKVEYVRSATVEKLTDQAALAKMGMWVRPELTDRVTDQAVLAKITVEAKDWDVRSAAVTKLTDPAVLAKIALEEK